VWQNAQKMANAIKANEKFQELTKTGTGQAVALAHDPNTKMLCKAKADWYCPERRLLVDLKTAEHADADSFARSIANYRYHVQDAFYRMVFSVASGVPVERFIFAVMEKPEKGIDPHPDRMAFYELTYEEVVAASNTFSSDLEALQYCMDNDTWAGYPQDILPIMRPHWAMKNDI
jgi:exodeoxyribonuclease VIII